ncbi:MAG: hypothetical protein NVS9B4_09820 [Candidatus Acidiferrum sp.]
MRVILEENREVIERAMEKHLGAYTGPEARDMVLRGMARNARLYCEEAESAQKWVVRSAQLECRRVSYELKIRI